MHDTLKQADSPAAARRPAVAGALTTTTAIVLATAPADGGAAAGLPLEGGTVLGRLLGQLGELGIHVAHLITRPRWESSLTPSGDGLDVRIHACEDIAADLRAIAQIARGGKGGVVLVYGEVITHREALAGLLADPRIVSGVLVARGRRRLAFGTRVRRGMIVSAASAFHKVTKADTASLGVVKIGAGDRALLAEAADRLAALAADPPADWRGELDRKERVWRQELGKLGLADEDDIRHRRAMVREDVVALLVVALVRSEVRLRLAWLRGLFWTRAGSEEAARNAAEELPHVDEDKVLLNSAVKAVDGFFTTFFVSPYSRYIARWAARRGLTPNQVTTASFALGVLSAACFATGERWGLIAGAVLLQIAFTTDCVDGQLARYTRRFSQFGAWLDSTFDRSKEYLVFGGLAIGASRAGDNVWLLAGVALTLQTVRHTFDFSWHGAARRRAEIVRHPPLEQSLDAWGEVAAARRAKRDAAGIEPKPAAEGREGPLARWRELDEVPGVAWVKRIVSFPIGERFAVISITAALWSARTTFTVLISWAALSAIYGLIGRSLRALRSKPSAEADPTRELESFRDDGPIARALGGFGGTLSPPVLVAVAVAPLLAAIAVRGDGASNGLAVAVIGWLVVIAGLSGGRTGYSRARWVVPPLLRLGEYAGLLWIAALHGPSARPAAFAVLIALAFRHYDIVYGLRYRGAPVSDRLGVAALGWDGRLVLACVLLLTGALPAGYYVLAVMIAAVFAGAAIIDWSRARKQPVTFHDDKEDEDA
ncbi:MAG: hypothetical protein QOH62_258 [Solirubrobacteraceae bacterium]|nr:hypothetical protein [Solirubrobacteraceae bacterium]